MKEKKLSCNGRVKGHGDATFKCMNAGFHIVNTSSDSTFVSLIYICDACKKRYDLAELIAAQTN